MKLVRRFNIQFAEVVKMIHQARYNAIKNINAELINLYWNIGKYIRKKLETAEWGDAVVDGLAEYIQINHPEFKGFTRRGFYRMKQFYETYYQNKIVSPLVTQISWTNHLIILSKTKTDEEREFYIKLSIKEKYSKRELERQIDSGYYERAILSKKKALPAVTHLHGDITNVFKDTYVLDFLNLPKVYSEKYLQRKIVADLIKEEDKYPVFGGNGLRGYTSKFTHDGDFVLIGRQGALCGNVNYANGQF